MLRESEAETEAGGRRSSSVVLTGEIWRKTVPPASTCETAAHRRAAAGRQRAHDPALAARSLRQRLPPQPSLLCRVQRDARLTRVRQPANGRRPAGFVKGTSESYEHSTHVGWRSAPHLHTSLHAPRAHMSGWTAGIGRGLVARRNAADGLSGHT